MFVCQHAILNKSPELSAAYFLWTVLASTTIDNQIAAGLLRRGSCSASTGPAPRKGAGVLITPPAPSGPEKRIINEPSLGGSAFRSGLMVGPQTGWYIRPCHNFRTPALRCSPALGPGLDGKRKCRMHCRDVRW